jgi:hypothetical protein
MWAVASAEERVIVTTQAVATNPKRQSTDSLAVQNESSLSSIEIEPCPCGLASATRWYIGNMPKSVSNTISRVAIGESAPAAKPAMAGM